MTAEDRRTAGAAAAATALGAFALSPVYASRAWLPPVLAVVLVVLAGGLLLRAGGPALWARATPGRPAPGRLSAAGVVLVPFGQLFLVVCLLTAMYAPGDAIAGVLPTRDSLAHLGGVLAEGSAELREQATPALPLTGLLALTTLFVGLIAVTVDLVAVAGHQAAVGGLALLVLYCVPVATITGGIGLVAVAAPAAGLALLLWADQQRRLASSGRGPRALLGAGTMSAIRIGVAAVLAGLVVGSLVPTLGEGSFTTGLGGGSGSATGTSLDPVAELQGQLTLPEPIDLLQVDTSVDDLGYLRAATLDEYDVDNGWSISNLDGEASIVDDDRLAPLPAGQTTRPVTVTVRVLEHDDRFLPVPTSPLTVRMNDAPGDDWRFDPTAGTVFGRGVSTTGQSYTVTAVEPRPSPELLGRASQLPPGDAVQQEFAAIPPLDPRVTDVVAEVVAGATSPYERVRRIHAFLTDRRNGFRYSLATEPGTSGDDLVDFLRLQRGYCEQYAGAMAVMVRAAGVPARMALGYTAGQVLGDGSRLITSDDAHAWVEVYFQGLGWVPFDPTPISVDRRADMSWAPRADADTPTADSAAEPVPLPAPAGPSARTDRADGPVPSAQLGQDDAAFLPRVLLVLGVVALAAAVVAAPAVARLLQRRRRVAAGTAGALWDELTASALDVGLRLHPAWTPRQAARELSAVMRKAGGPAGADGADAVRRLALAEEVASYGRADSVAARGPGHPDLVAALRTTRRVLLAAASRRTRFRARLWPASLVTATRSRTASWTRARLGALRPPRRRQGTRTV
jgi:transglutaminase-like putative cysteine protease